jgi:hypothetical protein
MVADCPLPPFLTLSAIGGPAFALFCAAIDARATTGGQRRRYWRPTLLALALGLSHSDSLATALVLTSPSLACVLLLPAFLS